MLQIRRATEVDATIIALLGRITFSESHEHFIADKKEFQAYLNKAFTIEKIKAELKDTNNLFWLVFKNDFPVGYSKLVINSPSEFLDFDKVCRLERIYILNDFLHLKIGSQLQELVFKKAKELQFSWVWLTVYAKNRIAVNFYEKNNYKEVEIINFYIGKVRYDNSVYAKELI